MARSFTRGRGRLGFARRQTAWLFVSTVETTLAGSPSASILSFLNAAALAMRPFTVVRTRGQYMFLSDVSGGVAEESFGCALGYVVVSDQASAIGVTAVPTPVTDKGSDLFFVYEQGFNSIERVDATGFGLVGTTVRYDSKAMRKVNDDEDIVITAENEVNGVIIIHSARMLIKLH